jgi:hypothetical protein
MQLINGNSFHAQALTFIAQNNNIPNLHLMLSNKLPESVYEPHHSTQPAYSTQLDHFATQLKANHHEILLRISLLPWSRRGHASGACHSQTGS